jgi:hypothetical protein
LLDRSPFTNPLFEPDKAVIGCNSRIVPCKQQAAVLAFIALLALLTAPFYRIRTSTAPTRLFLLFAINKKRELKPISIPLWQIFTWYGVEPLFTNYFLLLNPLL